MKPKDTGSTRAQSTAETIRKMITDGTFPPGTRLQAQKLADMLGVSRTPISEALSVLHKEGLLDYGAHRGYGVRSFDLKTVLDAFDVRLTLEGLACRLVSERGLSVTGSASLAANLQQTERVLFGERWSPEEHDHWRLLNLEFHDILLQEAANSYLTAGVLSARALPPIYNRSLQRFDQEELWPLLERPFSQQAFRDHARIVEAIEARQETRADNMMREHIFCSRETVRRIVGMIRDDQIGKSRRRRAKTASF